MRSRVSAVLVLSCVLLALTTRADEVVFLGGTFEGTFGVPLRPGLLTLRPVEGSDVAVTWKLTDGQRGTTNGTRQGVVVRFVLNNHRCQLVVTPDGGAVNGRCVEMLMAEARAPTEFSWDGTRVTGPLGVVLPGMRLPLPPRWDWEYRSADTAVVRNGDDTPMLVVRATEGKGALDALTQDALNHLSKSMGKARVDKSSATVIQGVPARQLRAMFSAPPTAGQAQEVTQTLGLVVAQRNGRVFTAAAAFPTPAFDARWEDVRKVLQGWLWVDAPPPQPAAPR
jgi:hypothetical protein